MTSDATPEFKQFLNLMGDTVALNGFKGYTGGLDVKCKEEQTEEEEKISP